MKCKQLLNIGALVTLLSFPYLTFGQAPNLGTASDYAIFTSVGQFDNSGTTTVTGKIGTNVGAFTGFPPGVVIGQIDVANAASAIAATDVNNAYTELFSRTCGPVIGVTLGNGQTLTPNTYCIGAAATLNGDLILDGAGNPNSVFIFKIDGAFATSVAARVVLTNSASFCNIYWQVNGQFILGDYSEFKGTIITNGAIHLLTGSKVDGRTLSRGGAINLDENVVSNALPPAASTITGSGATTFCGGNSVVLSGNNNGGTWSNGATSASITVTASGDYFVTDTSPCSSATSNHIIVVVQSLPTASIAAGGSTAFCQGGSVLLTASAASSYLWNTGATTQSITVSIDGNNMVTVTGANGCSAASAITTVTVDQIQSNSVTVSGATTFCQGGNITITGAPASSYLWSNGAITQRIVVTAQASYSVTSSNSCSTVTSAATVVTVNALPIATITASGATVFCQGGSVTLTANAAASYLWSNGATSQSIVVSTSGNNTVTITGGNGCVDGSTATAVSVSQVLSPNVTISGAASVSITGTSATFCQGGNVTITSAIATNYLWSNGAITRSIIVSVPGSFSVTASNACNTVTSTPTTVTINALPSATVAVSGATTFCEGGNVTLTGSAGTSYLWSNAATTQSIVVSVSGNNTVTVTGANGCFASSTVTSVVVNPLASTVVSITGAPSVSISGTSVTFCQGGVVTLTGGIGSSYLWSNNATTRTIVVSVSGIYNTTITNSCGNIVTSNVTVIVRPLSTTLLTVSGATTFCQGSSVTLTASAGTSYLWSNGATTQSIVVSVSGNFNTSISNVCGNKITSPVSVTVKSLPIAVITASGATTFCQGGNVTLTGSVGASYLWSTGATTQRIVVSVSGSNLITVTGANGCFATSAATTVTVNSPPLATISISGVSTVTSSPAVSITGNSAAFCQGGMVTLMASSGTAYVWSNGATTQSITVSVSGVYNTTITNVCGNIATSAITVTVNTLTAATFNLSGNCVNEYYIEGHSPIITFTGLPLGGTYAGPGIIGNTFNTTGAGFGKKVITYTITNGNNCVSSVSQSIVVYDTTGQICKQIAHFVIYDTTHVYVTDTLFIHLKLTGIASPNNKNTITAYPNPASDHLNINTGNFASMNGYSITIYNSLGVSVYTTSITQQFYTLDLSTWGGAGVYYMKILDTTNMIMETKKIILY